MNATLKIWHQFLETRNPKMLDDLLANNVIFYSPIVWTPQEGKIISFKVMIRPLKAINKVHEKMGEMLERLKHQKGIGN